MQVKTAVLLGRPGVGKTSLAHSLVGFGGSTMPTVAPELYALSSGGRVVHLWDTPGQEQYSAISAELLGKADLIVMCSCDGVWPERPKAAPAKCLYLRVRTKDDLGQPWFSADLATSATTGMGVLHLFQAIFALTEDTPEVADSCGCCGCGSCSAVATRTSVEQYRLDLLFGSHSV